MVILSEEDSRKYAQGAARDLAEFKSRKVVKWVESTFRDLKTFHPEVLPMLADLLPVDLYLWIAEVSPASRRIIDETLPDPEKCG